MSPDGDIPPIDKKDNCSVPAALSQLSPAFVIRAIALLTHAGLVVKCPFSLACKHAVCMVA